MLLLDPTGPVNLVHTHPSVPAPKPPPAQRPAPTAESTANLNGVHTVQADYSRVKRSAATVASAKTRAQKATTASPADARAADDLGTASQDLTHAKATLNGDLQQQITAAGKDAAGKDIVDPVKKQIAMSVRAQQLAPTGPADQASVNAFSHVVQSLVVQPLRTALAIEKRAAVATSPRAQAQSYIEEQVNQYGAAPRRWSAQDTLGLFGTTSNAATLGRINAAVGDGQVKVVPMAMPGRVAVVQLPMLEVRQPDGKNGKKRSIYWVDSTAKIYDRVFGGDGKLTNEFLENNPYARKGDQIVAPRAGNVVADANGKVATAEQAGHKDARQRGAGLLNAVTGGFEVAFGAGLTVTGGTAEFFSGGAGTPLALPVMGLGMALVFHGADKAGSGLNQAITNKPTQSLGQWQLEHVVSPQTAVKIGDGLDAASMLTGIPGVGRMLLEGNTLVKAAGAVSAEQLSEAAVASGTQMAGHPMGIPTGKLLQSAGLTPLESGFVQVELGMGTSVGAGRFGGARSAAAEGAGFTPPQWSRRGRAAPGGGPVYEPTGEVVPGPGGRPTTVLAPRHPAITAPRSGEPSRAIEPAREAPASGVLGGGVRGPRPRDRVNTSPPGKGPPRAPRRVRVPAQRPYDGGQLGRRQKQMEVQHQEGPSGSAPGESPAESGLPQRAGGSPPAHSGETSPPAGPASSDSSGGRGTRLREPIQELMEGKLEATWRKAGVPEDDIRLSRDTGMHPRDIDSLRKLSGDQGLVLVFRTPPPASRAWRELPGIRPKPISVKGKAGSSGLASWEGRWRNGRLVVSDYDSMGFWKIREQDRPRRIFTSAEMGEARGGWPREAVGVVRAMNQRLVSKVQHGAQDDYYSAGNRGVEPDDRFIAFNGGKVEYLPDAPAASAYYRANHLNWPYDQDGKHNPTLAAADPIPESHRPSPAGRLPPPESAPPEGAAMRPEAEARAVPSPQQQAGGSPPAGSGAAETPPGSGPASTDSAGGVTGKLAHPNDILEAGFAKKARDIGVTSREIVVALSPKVPEDSVTGFLDASQGPLKADTVRRAQSTGDAAYYVFVKLKNLKGINKKMNDVAADANVHIGAMARLTEQALRRKDVDVQSMRIGGPEMGFVLVGQIDEAAIQRAHATANRLIADYAAANDLAEIPHPGDPNEKGVGIDLGYAAILPERTLDSIFREARGRDGDVAGSEGPASGDPGTVSGTSRATDPGTGTARGGATGGGEAAPGSAARRAQASISDLTGDPRPESFVNPDFAALLDFNVRARRLGLPEWQIQKLAQASHALRPFTVIDEVTGTYAGNLDHVKADTVRRAQQVVDITDDVRAYFVAWDFVNLSGLSKSLGKQDANVHYRAIIEIHVRSLVRVTGGKYVPMRTGGDEGGGVAIGPWLTEQRVQAALRASSRNVRIYVAENGLAKIPHTKATGRPGAGLHFGLAQIFSDLSLHEIFEAADLGINRSKEAGGTPSAGIGTHPPSHSD